MWWLITVVLLCDVHDPPKLYATFESSFLSWTTWYITSIKCMILPSINNTWIMFWHFFNFYFIPCLYFSLLASCFLIIFFMFIQASHPLQILIWTHREWWVVTRLLLNPFSQANRFMLIGETLFFLL